MKVTICDVCGEQYKELVDASGLPVANSAFMSTVENKRGDRIAFEVRFLYSTTSTGPSSFIDCCSKCTDKVVASACITHTPTNKSMPVWLIEVDKHEHDFSGHAVVEAYTSEEALQIAKDESLHDVEWNAPEQLTDLHSRSTEPSVITITIDKT